MTTFAGKVAVRDSFDEDISDDVDDEVFIRDGRNGFKIDEERGVKRPLMAPRRRLKTSKLHSIPHPHPRVPCKSCLAPCCYAILALAALLGLFSLAVIMFKFVPTTLDQFRFWKSRSAHQDGTKVTVPCSDFTMHDVWTKSFPKLTSETAVRLSDVNKDNILDIILGYGTGADGRNMPDFVCSLYFKRDPPCLGGILALDGRNGEVIWQHWTQRPVFTVDCAADLTEDGIQDCLIGGKGGLLHAVNGHDGSLLWHLEDTLQQQQVEPLLDIYSAQYIPDIDGDNFVDVVAAHTASASTGGAFRGHFLLLSGKTGSVLRMVDMPGASESYFAPQMLVHLDGEKKVLVGTGSTSGSAQGGIHTIPLSVLATSNKLSFNPQMVSDSFGLMAPPVLADINHDGVEDVIASLFNSTVVALDGRTFLPLWNYTFSNSQSLSAPTPGYFNNDDVPDFLVKYQSGPGFPQYYYSQTNILDGKTGLPLLDHHIVDSMGSQMGGLSITMEGMGNDWFLYWTANCVGYEGTQTPFSFAKGSNLISQSHADLCRLRFNSSMSATLWAISQHTDLPGIALYSSEWRLALEYNGSQNIHNEAYQYLASHPDFWTAYGPQSTVGRGMPKNGASSPGGTSWSKSLSDLATSEFKHSFRGSAFNSAPSSSNDNLGDDLNRLGLNSERVKGERRMGEGEDSEEPEYPHLQLPTGKNRRLPNWQKEEKNWNIDVGPGKYIAEARMKEVLNAQSSDSVNHDYDLRPSDIGDDPHLPNDYSGLLVNLQNSNSEARELPSNFLQAIHDEAMQGKRLERSYFEEVQEQKDLDPKSLFRKTKQTKSTDFDNKTTEKREEAFNQTNNDRPRGIYPITSIGTLAPPLSGSGIDLIIVSYWIPPSEGVQILFPNDEQCIRDGIARASSDETDKFSGMNEDTLELAVTAECLLYRFSASASMESDTQMESHHLEPYPGFLPLLFARSTSRMNVYNNMDVSLGQLTVYRLNLQCQCQTVKTQSETCAKILPFEKQGWPSHMGHGGKGYFHPRF